MNKNQSVGVLIVAILLILSLASMLMNGNPSSTHDLSYSQFITMVKKSEIKSVQIERDTLIAHPVNDEIKPATNLPLNKLQTTPSKLQYKVIIPMNDNSLYTTLEENNVEVALKTFDESNSLVGVLKTIAPIFIVIIILMIMAKFFNPAALRLWASAKAKQNF